MKNTVKRIGILSLIFVLVAGMNVGCRKKKDTIAEITVRNSAGAIVAGANVKLYPKPSNTDQGGSTAALLWEYETVTNSAGVASFNFNEIYQLGQAGVAVANISASHSGKTGTGVIKVQQETVSTATFQNEN
mgnify:CR=1 FL=1